jgi:hypothetical protein
MKAIYKQYFTLKQGSEYLDFFILRIILTLEVQIR